MRVLILAALVAVTTADLWEDTSSYMDEIVMKMSSGLAEAGLLNDDKSNWNANILMYLGFADTEMCPSQYETCSGALLLGCNCQDAINELPGDCPMAPCDLYRTIVADGPGVIKELISDSSLGVKADKVLTDVVRPIYESLCSCRGLIGAAETCAKKYDGMMLSQNETEREQYFTTVEDIPWGKIKKLIKSFFDVICEDGCGVVFGDVMRNMITIWENSLSAEYEGDVCLSLRRVEDEIKEYIAAFAFDHATRAEGLEAIAEKYLEMEEAAVCAADCAATLQADFYYSCCSVNLGRLVSSQPFQTKVGKVVSHYVDEDIGAIKSFLADYVKPWNPAAFCGESTEVYEEMNQSCGPEL